MMKRTAVRSESACWRASQFAAREKEKSARNHVYRYNAMQVEKKGVVEKFQTIQDTCLQVQESMDVVASLFERIEKFVSLFYGGIA